VAAKAVGIGLATSAAGAAARILTLKPRAVVLVGTCGVYAGASSLAVGGVAIGRRVVLADLAVARGEAAYPEPMSIEATCDRALAEGLAAHGGTRVDIATTLAVTTNDTTAATLSARTACDAEHLEAYGVAAACAAESVPFVAALGVANTVGGRARDEWKRNHRAASAAAIGLLVKWMSEGAAGVAR
jgi:nucleoside phosphorylase